jgi:hypothetical protein
MVFDFGSTGDFSRRDDCRVIDLAATLTRASSSRGFAATSAVSREFDTCMMAGSRGEAPVPRQ